MNPLLLGPQLVLRALDDLHTIARAAARLEDVERRIDGRLAAVLELGERIEELGGRVDERIGQVDARAAAVLDQGRRLEQVAAQVAERGGQIAEAMPVLQRAVELAVPLEGAVERLGRMVDRLPQVPQRRPRAAAKA
jgi:hypothetical protein